MGHPTDPSFLALHTVRLKAFASAGATATATGLSIDDARTVLDRAVAAGMLELRQGRLSGYHLTAAGRAQDDELVAAEMETGVDRAAIAHAYQHFRGLNTELLDACTAWQLRPSSPSAAADAPLVRNDHRDQAHDTAVIARLAAVDDVVQAVCADLATVLARFGTYGPRLATARTRLEAGELEWFTKPIIDSYHTVWFELHEDLLCTLGIQRSKENET